MSELYDACRAGEIDLVQNLVCDNKISAAEFSANGNFAFRQACKSCNFALIRWLYDRFAPPVDEICINNCLKSFPLDAVEDMIWLCEAGSFTVEQLEFSLIPFSRVNFQWEADLPSNEHNLQALLDAVKQGPLVKPARMSFY
jgi:hypothetical protein